MKIIVDSKAFAAFLYDNSGMLTCKNTAADEVEFELGGRKIAATSRGLEAGKEQHLNFHLDQKASYQLSQILAKAQHQPVTLEFWQTGACIFIRELTIYSAAYDRDF